MKRWAVVIALAGCDHVFQLETVGKQLDAAPDGAPDAATFSCPVPVLADDFTGTTPCAPWGSFFPTTNATASEGGHDLTFHLPANGEARCQSAANVAVPTGGIAVRFKVLPSGASSYMTLESATLGVEITVQSGRIKLQVNGGGAPPYAEEQYSGTAMQYVRLVPDPGNKRITGSYSADAITWTDMTVTAPYPATPPMSIDVQLKAGALVTGSASDATFQHLMACP